MGKLMIGLTRILPLCAVLLLLPAVAAAQPAPLEESPMRILEWISILQLAVSLATLVVLAWLYRRMSASQMDDNIINTTNSILVLLEKVKTLNSREQSLLAHWLNDWDYFRPPRIFNHYKGPKATDKTIEQLKQYFNEFADEGKSSQHSQ